MPPVYVVAQIRVKDQATWEQYRSKVAPLVPKYGGQYPSSTDSIVTVIDGYTG